LFLRLDISEQIPKNGTSVQCMDLCNTERRKEIHKKSNTCKRGRIIKNV
jgi:hypothetical protein